MYREWIIFIVCAILAVVAPYYLLTSEKQNQQPVSELNVSEIKLSQTTVPNILLTKPLFNSERRVFIEKANEATAELVEDSAAPPPPLPAEPKLVGVAIGRGKSVAIVKANDGRDTNLKIGENVDGWKLVSISRNSVIFSTQGARKKVDLDYSNSNLGGPISDGSISNSSDRDN